MSFKQTDIRMMELWSQLNKVGERINEIQDEQLTLANEVNSGGIDPTLLMLKDKVMTYELKLLKEKLMVLYSEFKAVNLVVEMGLDYTPEEF